MFEYKDARFYTQYFRNNGSFEIVEDFKESDDKNEKNLYVGIVKVLNTVHPLVLRVEIPYTFPHNKLAFRTKSISGYPHLIHTGKTEYGDWFCLNTPFAETPEEQLNQEILRLQGWIAHQMRIDLPAIIKDAEFKQALAIANAYDWENPDEVKEFSSQAMLTFVGDFCNDVSYFKKSLGSLSCIKTSDGRFYAFANSSIAECKLPYIIVNQPPKSVENLKNCLMLKEQYGWDDKTCEHILPDFNITGLWEKDSSILKPEECNETDALKQLEVLEQELGKDESYLPAASIKQFGKLSEITGKNKKPTKVMAVQKPVILKEIESMKDDVLQNHGYKGFDIKSLLDYSQVTEEEQAEQDYYNEVYPYELHHFAFGLRQENSIEWCILFTNHSAAQYDKTRFDLCLKELELRRLTAVPLEISGAQVLTRDMYWGRGAFSSTLLEKRVALVGLGAIGSMVAASLARSGVFQIGLWDSDIVEPGNICRSSYSLKNIGDSKVNAIASIIRSINPFVKTNEISLHGVWVEADYTGNLKFVGGSFYDNVNYDDQKDSIKEIQGYDIIIDCTGSNEMLHFLSYAVQNTDILSLCITNHANDLLCVSNKDGNPFELRKAYLARIEQDTKNFYVEGSGCYSPTFLAKNCDIDSLVNLALRDVDRYLGNGQLMHSTIYSYSDRGVVADRLTNYKLNGYDILLTIPSETLYDAEEIADSPDGAIGYVFGLYSKDGKHIMITHIVDSLNAKILLSDAYETSNGLIDYIGDYRYSCETSATYSSLSLELMANKAADITINTNNPLLAVRNPDGSITFFLYINNGLVQFIMEN